MLCSMDNMKVTLPEAAPLQKRAVTGCDVVQAAFTWARLSQVDLSPDFPVLTTLKQACPVVCGVRQHR